MSKRRLATTSSRAAPRFTFFGGKGGVGKTTCAAARAVALAELGDHPLVLSTDPAHSLGDVLDTRVTATPRRIAGVRGGRLKAAELDAGRALDRWLARRRGAFQDILLHGTFLDDDDVTSLMRLALPGVDELMGLLEIERLALAGDYTEVVVDMAPTGHALRLLQMPQTQRDLARLFDDMQEKHRIVVTRMGGRYREDACDAVIAELDGAGRRWQSMLSDPDRVAFHWVTLPESMVLAETRGALAALRRARQPVVELIVNRVTPAPEARCGGCSRRRHAEAAVMTTLTKMRPRPPLRLLPALDREPRGVASLRSLGRLLTKTRPSRVRTREPGRAPRALPSAERREAIPLGVPAERRLLAFGGKGGVGKTTCSAAVASAVAMQSPARRVLLLSVDPAHSLGDVFGVRIGNRARRIVLQRGTLRLRELDAERVFELHQVRLRRALDQRQADSAAGAVVSVDDRRLVRQVLDLTPPGIDELFALLAIVDALGLGSAGATEEAPRDQRRSADRRTRARHSYDLVVLDTAPTGHTLRLIEMLGHAREWLKTLLAILFKYREIVTLNEIAADLVRMSRGLREFDDLLKDPARTEFVVVTRAASVVRAETDDLLRALRRAAVPVSTIVVNGLTSGTCRRCAGRMAAERREIRRLRQGCRSARRPCVILTTPAIVPPPRGADQLIEWGRQWAVIE